MNFSGNCLKCGDVVKGEYGGCRLVTNIEELFGQWDETIIWSCLQGVMGEIYTNSPEDDARMAILGDFVFYAGNPSEKLLRFKPESCNQDFIIMVP